MDYNQLARQAAQLGSFSSPEQALAAAERLGAVPDEHPDASASDEPSKMECLLGDLAQVLRDLSNIVGSDQIPLDSKAAMLLRVRIAMLPQAERAQAAVRMALARASTPEPEARPWWHGRKDTKHIKRVAPKALDPYYVAMVHFSWSAPGDSRRRCGHAHETPDGAISCRARHDRLYG